MLTDEQLEDIATLFVAPQVDAGEILDLKPLLRAVEAAAITAVRADSDRVLSLQQTSYGREIQIEIEIEREACAKVCDAQARDTECHERAVYCASAIRERSNV